MGIMKRVQHRVSGSKDSLMRILGKMFSCIDSHVREEIQLRPMSNRKQNLQSWPRDPEGCVYLRIDYKKKQPP